MNTLWIIFFFSPWSPLHFYHKHFYWEIYKPRTANRVCILPNVLLMPFILGKCPFLWKVPSNCEGKRKDQESRKKGKEGLGISTRAQSASLPYSFLCAVNRRQIIRQVIRHTSKICLWSDQEFHMVWTSRVEFFHDCVYALSMGRNTAKAHLFFLQMSQIC